MIAARRIAALILDRFIELAMAGVLAVGLLAGLAKAALDHAGDGLPLTIASDTVSRVFLPKPELKPCSRPL
ncbi:MAG TPA: hypothetical protein VHQ39_00760 [Dongiaceae bacterium]|jgi:hypothetical protein|nr:hypothetical protein [Dongiaceae bacterium]